MFQILMHVDYCMLMYEIAFSALQLCQSMCSYEDQALDFFLKLPILLIFPGI